MKKLIEKNTGKCLEIKSVNWANKTVTVLEMVNKYATEGTLKDLKCEGLSDAYLLVREETELQGQIHLQKEYPNLIEISEFNDWPDEYLQDERIKGRIFVSKENLLFLLQNAFDLVRKINEPANNFPANPQQNIDGGTLVYLFTLPEEGSLEAELLANCKINIELK